MTDFADITETRKLEPIKRRKSKAELLARDIEDLQIYEMQVQAAKAKLLERGVAA